MVTEFCTGGSLRNLLINSRINPSENSPDYINMTSTLNHRELLKLAVDIANGMAHLSSQKVCVVILCRAEREGLGLHMARNHKHNYILLYL